MLGIIVYLVVYFVMPHSVDTVLKIGLYVPGEMPAFAQLKEEGLEFEAVSTEGELRQAIIDGRFIAGIALPPDILNRLVGGERPTITMFFAADTPQEVKGAVEGVIEELGYRMVGQSFAIEVSEKVLGPDLAGIPLPPRDRLRLLLALMLIMIETMGLATIISEEIERRTIHALLVTPDTVADVFTAKGISGISLAFGQAAFFMAVVGGLNWEPLIVLTALFLGAVLVIAAGFIIGAVAKDMLSVLARSMPVIIILIIPCFPSSKGLGLSMLAVRNWLGRPDKCRRLWCGSTVASPP